MTNEERQQLFELLEKAKTILPRAEYISVEKGPNNSLTLFGIKVFAQGSPEFMNEDEL
jgi:hypothetical protein